MSCSKDLERAVAGQRTGSSRRKSGGVASGIGVGMQPGVLLMQHVSRCLRRPHNLQTSLKMMSDGFDYDRCCEQLLLPNPTGAGGALLSVSQGTRLSSVVSSGAAGGQSDVPPVAAVALGDDANEDAEETQVIDFGIRLLNCASRVQSRDVALQQAMRPGLRSRNGGSRSEIAQSTSSASDVASVPRLDKEDDDTATQMYHAHYTLADIERQLRMVHEHERMVASLTRRFGQPNSCHATPSEGSATCGHTDDILAPALYGGRILQSQQKLAVDDAPAPALNRRTVPPDVWGWDRSPSQNLLPPVAHQEALRSPQQANSPHRVALLDENSGAVVRSAVRLAPLTAPVSFAPEPARATLDVPLTEKSPLRRSTSRQLLHSPATIRQRKHPNVSSQENGLRRSSPSALPPIASPGLSDAFLEQEDSSPLAAAMRRAVEYDGAMAGIVSYASEAAPLYQFEVRRCLEDVVESLKAVYE